MDGFLGVAVVSSAVEFPRCELRNSGSWQFFAGAGGQPKADSSPLNRFEMTTVRAGKRMVRGRSQ